MKVVNEANLAVMKFYCMLVEDFLGNLLDSTKILHSSLSLSTDFVESYAFHLSLV